MRPSPSCVLTSFRYQRLWALLAVFSTVVLLLTTIPAGAQETGRSTISGIVTDSAGAVVAGAQVTATNLEMNVSESTVTNGTGYYEIDSLNPGTYKIAVSASGFDNLL
jgi:hypothetical protein